MEILPIIDYPSLVKNLHTAISVEDGEASIANAKKYLSHTLNCASDMDSVCTEFGVATQNYLSKRYIPFKEVVDLLLLFKDIFAVTRNLYTNEYSAEFNSDLTSLNKTLHKSRMSILNKHSTTIKRINDRKRAMFTLESNSFKSTRQSRLRPCKIKNCAYDSKTRLTPSQRTQIMDIVCFLPEFADERE